MQVRGKTGNGTWLIRIAQVVNIHHCNEESGDLHSSSTHPTDMHVAALAGKGRANGLRLQPRSGQGAGLCCTGVCRQDRGEGSPKGGGNLQSTQKWEDSSSPAPQPPPSTCTCTCTCTLEMSHWQGRAWRSCDKPCVPAPLASCFDSFVERHLQILHCWLSWI